MKLTEEQQRILDGAEGEVKAKVMKTLIQYGELFGAKEMVPVTSRYNHLVTSFGLNSMQPMYDLLDKLIAAAAVSQQKFTVDPRPLDPNVPSSFLQDIVFKKAMYTMQAEYEKTLKTLGLLSDDSFTCTCYMSEVGNIPQKGEVLSWAESSAVVYANSVLGARCNRNSAVIDLMGSVAGFVPAFGFVTDEGRKASWVVEIRTSKKPEAQLLGSAIGMKVMEAVPYVVGLDQWLGNELNDETKAYLKDFGAATASNGAVGLYHIDGLTPEAVESGRSLIREDAQVYVIDDKELQHVYDEYPIVWKKKDSTPKLCFIGCPHLSYSQLCDWSDKITEEMARLGRDQLAVPTVFTAAPKVIEKFKNTPKYWQLINRGAVISYICPLMYMNNPLSASMPVITCSNKLRTYTTARFYTEKEILGVITGGKS